MPVIDFDDLRRELRADPTTLDLSIDGGAVYVIGGITNADIATVVRILEEENITSLVTVKIPSTEMTVASIPALKRILLLQPNLAHLALHDNGHLGVAGSTAVAEMINSLPPLTSFDYHHCEAGPLGILDIMYALANRHRESLITLNLGNNVRINEEWPIGASQYFLYFTELQDLCLIDNNLRADDMAALGNAIKDLPLTKLYIGANYFGDQGAIELFSRIESMASRLEVLVFDECEHLNDQALLVVLNAVVNNTSFRKQPGGDRGVFLGAGLNTFSDALIRVIGTVNAIFNEMRSDPIARFNSRSAFPLAYRNIYVRSTANRSALVKQFLVMELRDNNRILELLARVRITTPAAPANPAPVNQVPAPAPANPAPAPRAWSCCSIL